MRKTAASTRSLFGAAALALVALVAPPATGQSYNFTHLAGAGSVGIEDGIGSQARFNHPQGIAVDGQGCQATPKLTPLRQ